ncbi:MAG TPA: hypothetical protein VJT71_05600 [Pyrinomonadaceae bacterium]|nr:hypothetical protein [Pyrinomonadaceae bacterium]
MKRLAPVVVAVLLLTAISACKFGSSPTATFKAFWEAQKKKDIPGMKKTMSKASMAMLEKGAKQQNKTVDEAITEGFNTPGAKYDKIPESRNEKITGNDATLEIQDETSKKWETMYFVKEDGEWKIALDKTIEELLKKVGQP